jgi:protein SCO1/2
MKSASLTAALLLTLAPHSSAAAERYPVTGVILKIDRPHRTFVASCAAIPGYMEAMVMPFTVREEKALDGLDPSTPVEFTLVVEGRHSYAEAIRVHHYESLEQEPLRARRLQLLADPGGNHLTLGQPVADFALTDQTGQRVALSQFAGKVVALTFIYTSCPLPDYCFRLSNNFGRLSKRFSVRMGRDLVLLSITFDPGPRPTQSSGQVRQHVEGRPEIVALPDRHTSRSQSRLPPIRPELLAGGGLTDTLSAHRGYRPPRKAGREFRRQRIHR